MFCCFGLFFACANILLINPRVLYSVWILHNIILYGMQGKCPVLNNFLKFLVMYCNRNINCNGTVIMFTLILSPIKKIWSRNLEPLDPFVQPISVMFFGSRGKEKYYCSNILADFSARDILCVECSKNK